MEIKKGDSHLYTAAPKSHLSGEFSFKRMYLNTVSSRRLHLANKDEEKKHRNKLHRKGMAKKCNESKFLSNRLHHIFFSISGQQDGGFFAAKSRLTQFLS